MSALEALLEVQEHDTAVDRLRHRLAHLPERGELAALEVRMAEVRSRAAHTQASLGEVLGRQSKLEDSIAAVDRRITEIEGRLYSGQVTATRDIMAMTAEVESLKVRRSSLEDEELGTMEEEEPLAGEVRALQAEEAALEAEAERVRACIAEVEQAVEVEMSAVARARAVSAGLVPETLLATYEKLRSGLGGVGAARLVGRSCSGCHLTLPAQELDRIKREPADTLVLCEQCGRILVR